MTAERKVPGTDSSASSAAFVADDEPYVVSDERLAEIRSLIEVDVTGDRLYLTDAATRAACAGAIYDLLSERDARVYPIPMKCAACGKPHPGFDATAAWARPYVCECGSAKFEGTVTFRG